MGCVHYLTIIYTILVIQLAYIEVNLDLDLFF